MRRPGRPRSLRAQLVATVLLLLAVAGTVIGVATTLAVREVLYHRLDRGLEEAAAGFVEDETGVPVPVTGRPAGGRDGRRDRGGGGPGESGPGAGDPFSRGSGPGTVTAVRRDGEVQGSYSTRRGEVRELDHAEAAVVAGLPVNGRPVTRELPSGAYRWVAREVYALGQQVGDVEAVVGGTVVIELVVIGLTLAGAGVAGAVALRRQLRPLERVAETAASVSRQSLDRGEVALVDRVPDPDPRTEVGQVGAALNRMLDNVEGALEARQASETRLRQFVADASHELRTPLAAIRGYAELSRRRGGEHPDTAHAVERISSQAERMTMLVEDLLLLARLDAGRPLEHAAVDLTHLVLDAVGDARVAGPEHRWQLDLPDEPVTVPGDASRLAQVLANLLANARTHTPPGTQVTVGLRRDRPGGEVLLTVTDAGPGIPPELLPHVFERFTRGERSRSRAQGSTGLGLAIVDAVVTAHGGTVAVDSRSGRTRFAVRLPGGRAFEAEPRPG